MYFSPLDAGTGLQGVRYLTPRSIFEGRYNNQVPIISADVQQLYFSDLNQSAATVMIASTKSTPKIVSNPKKDGESPLFSS
jgi:hypothetical protein